MGYSPQAYVTCYTGWLCVFLCSTNWMSKECFMHYFCSFIVLLWCIEYSTQSVSGYSTFNFSLDQVRDIEAHDKIQSYACGELFKVIYIMAGQLPFVCGTTVSEMYNVVGANYNDVTLRCGPSVSDIWGVITVLQTDGSIYTKSIIPSGRFYVNCVWHRKARFWSQHPSCFDAAPGPG